MPTYRKKATATITADQWFPGKHVAGVCLCREDEFTLPGGLKVRGAPHVHTAHKQAVPIVGGDWIIPEPNGNGHYPCKDEIFQATYERVEDTEGHADGTS